MPKLAGVSPCSAGQISSVPPPCSTDGRSGLRDAGAAVRLAGSLSRVCPGGYLLRMAEVIGGQGLDLTPDARRLALRLPHAAVTVPLLRSQVLQILEEGIGRGAQLTEENAPLCRVVALD